MVTPHRLTDGSRVVARLRANFFGSITLFVTGLQGPEGAHIDPASGNFLFSTFGGGNVLIAIRGFTPNPPPPPPG